MRARNMMALWNEACAMDAESGERQNAHDDRLCICPYLNGISNWFNTRDEIVGGVTYYKYDLIRFRSLCLVDNSRRNRCELFCSVSFRLNRLENWKHIHTIHTDSSLALAIMFYFTSRTRERARAQKRRKRARGLQYDLIAIWPATMISQYDTEPNHVQNRQNQQRLIYIQTQPQTTQKTTFSTCAHLCIAYSYVLTPMSWVCQRQRANGTLQRIRLAFV